MKPRLAVAIAALAVPLAASACRGPEQQPVEPPMPWAALSATEPGVKGVVVYTPWSPPESRVMFHTSDDALLVWHLKGDEVVAVTRYRIAGFGGAGEPSVTKERFEIHGE